MGCVVVAGLAALVADRVRGFMDSFDGPVFVLHSGGLQSSFIVASMGSLPIRYLEDVVVVYVELEGNTFPGNVRAALDVFRSSFPDGRVVGPVVFDGDADVIHEAVGRALPGPSLIHVVSRGWLEGVERYGLVANRRRRWCYTRLKHRVFQSLPALSRVDGRWCRLTVSGLSSRDSRFRRRVDLVERFYSGVCFVQLNPLFDVDRFEVLREAQDLYMMGSVLKLYRVFGDSLNCVVCPLRGRGKSLRVFRALRGGPGCDLVRETVERIMRRGVSRRVEEDVVSAAREAGCLG